MKVQYNTFVSKDSISIRELSAFKMVEDFSCWHASTSLAIKIPLVSPPFPFSLCLYHRRSSRYFLATEGTYSDLEGADSLGVSIVEAVSGPLSLFWSSKRSTRAKDLSLFDSTLAKNLKLLVFPTCRPTRRREERRRAQIHKMGPSFRSARTFYRQLLTSIFLLRDIKFTK